MNKALHLFRLKGADALVLTADRTGSCLPIDVTRDYKPGDWHYVDMFSSDQLPTMVTNHAEVWPALRDHGFFTIRHSQVLRNHPFFKRHPPLR
jgi:hypothetical protein